MNRALKHVGTTATSLLACIVMGAALAQTYPARTVRIIVSAAPGGLQDQIGRAMAPELSGIWGQPVVIDNRVGAGDVIAATAASQAPPDGHAIFFSNSAGMNSAEFLRRNLPYDPVKAFEPVVGIMVTHGLLVVANKLPVGTVRELVELARAKPRTLHYGSFGVGSASHLDAAAFAKAAGIELVHVPYKGVPPAVRALIAGEIDLVIGSLASYMPPARQGQIKALAYTGPRVSRQIPDVPTLASAGYDLDREGLHLFYVPAGTPRAITEKIAADVGKVRDTAAFREKYIYPIGMEELAVQGAELAARLQRARSSFAASIKGLDIRLD
jgi:tripartite-type tricarboxylate transporter receptor subunit TctC